LKAEIFSIAGNLPLNKRIGMLNVIIIGGNINAKLNSWLLKLGVVKYYYMDIHSFDISPDKLHETGELIRNSIPSNASVISVGLVADKLLNSCFVVHGALPATHEEDELKIRRMLKKCKEFLTQRSIYDPTRSF
jgi:hypothetical protein